MDRKISLIVVLVVAAQAAVVPNTKLKLFANKYLGERLEEDAVLTVPQLITKYGYPVESHVVTTEDNYILTMHRIPHGINQKPSEVRPVVFLQHGLFGSSSDWIITGTKNALGYILADLGYDVWMGNARGNVYSRKHTQLNPDKGDAFWNFSWHQIGIYDLPAMIDYALGNTKQESLFYVGHSQGTTSFYVMCSEKPAYNAKIKAQISLAPIAFMNHMTSPLMQIIAKASIAIDLVTQLIGLNEFLPKSELLALAGETFCGDDDLTQILCSNSLFVVCGFDIDQLNTTTLPIIMAHSPAGASTKQMVHYGQEINSGHFRQFDYGFIGNMKHYGTMSPPHYDLTKITTPVYLMYSHNDWLAAESDVLKLYGKLGNAKEKFLITDKKWNHLDFVYGIDAPSLVYEHLAGILELYKK